MPTMQQIEADFGIVVNLVKEAKQAVDSKDESLARSKLEEANKKAFEIEILMPNKNSQVKNYIK